MKTTTKKLNALKINISQRRDKLQPKVLKENRCEITP